MAVGSWMGIYISVSDELMAERREQELLLLMAIMRHADRLGFCYPGRARLMAMRRISQPVFERRIAFLEERCLVKMTEGWDYKRRQVQFDFQISPRAIYVREEFQEYCERVFDGEQERDYQLENWFLENHFSTNDSQPETEPDVVPESVTRRSEPDARTRNHNQRGASLTQKGRKSSTMRNGAQPTAQKQPTATNATAHSKDNPQAGGADDFDKLLSPTFADADVAEAIRFAVATTEHQARDIVANFPRDGIVHWLRHTAIRRSKGELKNPGGYFYGMLKRNVMPFTVPGPNGQIDEYEIP